MQEAGIDVDSLFAAAELEELGRGLMAESARAEVHPNPDPAVFVGEQVYIMVPRPHRPELIARHSLELRDLRHVLPERAVEQLMLDLLSIGAPHSKADVLGNFRQDG